MMVSFVLSSAKALEGESEGEYLIVLWPKGAPGAVGRQPEDIPALTLYLPPKGKATGAAIIICPGGGYDGLSNREGGPIAEWLNSIGVTAFVLKYRIAPRYRHPAPLQDAARAIRTVRARAAEWRLDPERIGILGFSAGGHLASTAGTHFEAGKPNDSDTIERVSSRPNLMMLIYPVITMKEQTHARSKLNLLGSQPNADLVSLLSNELHITKDTPPTFLVHAVNDSKVPVENSLLFVAALRKAAVPLEVHLYEEGEHGFALGRDPIRANWPPNCANWLRLHGFVAPERYSHGRCKVPHYPGSTIEPFLGNHERMIFNFMINVTWNQRRRSPLSCTETLRV